MWVFGGFGGPGSYIRTTQRYMIFTPAQRGVYTQPLRWCWPRGASDGRLRRLYRHHVPVRSDAARVPRVWCRGFAGCARGYRPDPRAWRAVVAASGGGESGVNFVVNSVVRSLVRSNRTTLLRGIPW